MTPQQKSALQRLKNKLSPGEIRFDEVTLKAHAGDKWFASHLPEVVALPLSTDSVSLILKAANQHRVPVTPRGAGHGYVGGCVPSHGGIALSLARMNKIREIHSQDFVGVVQPGVITKEFQDKVEQKGLFYPPDPASRADCSLGGNIATNAGGPRCLKYGVTRDYVLGLEIVLADGRITRVGGRTHKNKSGFDLTRLIVGSEGLLAIVTEATHKLLPLPPYRACMAIGFVNTREAVKTLAAILKAGFLPCALEIADSFTLAAARKRTGSKQLEGCNSILIVELDGHEQSVRGEIKTLETLVRTCKPVFIDKGLGPEACEKIWQVRREFSYSLRDTGLTKLNEDIVVPRGKLEDLFQFAGELQKKHGLQLACFGHAGDGNIHCNIMVDMEQPGAKKRSEAALDDLFAQVIAWNGVITGEHGIGLAKMPWWPEAASDTTRWMHREIKKALDPNLILNPGKFV